MVRRLWPYELMLGNFDLGRVRGTTETLPRAYGFTGCLQTLAESLKWPRHGSPIQF